MTDFLPRWDTIKVTLFDSSHLRERIYLDDLRQTCISNALAVIQSEVAKVGKRGNRVEALVTDLPALPQRQAGQPRQSPQARQPPPAASHSR